MASAEDLGSQLREWKFFSSQRADNCLDVLGQRAIGMREDSISKKGNGKLAR